MQAEFVRGNYDQMPYTPGANWNTGDVIVIGSTPTICNQPGGFVSGRLYSVAVRRGIYEMTAAGAYGARVKVYWDDTAKRVTTTSSGNTVFGWTDAASSGAGASVDCEHDPSA